MANLPKEIFNEIYKDCIQIIQQCEAFSSLESLQEFFKLGTLSNYSARLPSPSYPSPLKLAKSTFRFMWNCGIDENGCPLLHLLKMLYIDAIQDEISGEKLYELHTKIYQKIFLHECEYFLQTTQTPDLWKAVKKQKYSAADFVKIVEIFFECSWLQEKANRDHLIATHYFSKEYKQRRSSSNTPLEDVIYLTQAWLASNREMDLLAYLIEEEEKKVCQISNAGRIWEELDVLLCKYRYTFTTYRQMQEVYAILIEREWPEESKLIQAYRDSFPEGYEVKRPAHNDNQKRMILDHLEETTNCFNSEKNNCFSSLFIYVYTLASYAKQLQRTDISDRLQQWIEKQGNKLKWTKEQLELQEQTAKSQRGPSLLYLMISLSDLGSGQFCAQAWLMDKNNALIAEFEKPNQIIEQTGFEKYVDELYEMWSKHALSFLSSELQIEVFLPSKFLNLPADEWRIDISIEDGPLLRPLGREYQVVIRSLARATGRKSQIMQKQWQERWKALEKAPSNGSQAIKIPPHQDGWKREKLYNDWVKEFFICLGLTFAPPEESGIFSAFVHAGIPIALWPRAGSEVVSQVEDWLQKLSHSDLRELPRHMKEKRHNAYERNDQDPFQCFTLFWDDPTRPLPPVSAPMYAMPQGSTKGVL